MGKDSENRVGYGNPPEHTRWKPGQSGNPKGRPKKTKDVEKLFQRELDATIRITERGESRTITKREALVKGVINDALRGSKHAQKIALGFMQDSVELEGFVADPEDHKAFENFVQRLNGDADDSTCADEGGDDDG